MDYNAVIDVVKDASKFVFDDSLKSDVSMKGSADYVTAVDLKISSFVKDRLAVLTPEIGFMSEEEEGELQPSRWILDPIDGTTNLVSNYNAVRFRLHILTVKKYSSALFTIRLTVICSSQSAVRVFG